VDGLFHWPQERPTRAKPGLKPPVVGERVSMGQEDRWQIVEVVEFDPVDADHQFVERVFLATVHPVDLPLPERETWSAIAEAGTTLQLHLSDEVELLQVAWDVLGNAPVHGERLQHYEPVPGHETRQRAIPTPWQIMDSDAYIPVDEQAKAHFPAIYLAWCEQIAFLAVA
jgi:hypothetical protein